MEYTGKMRGMKFLVVDVGRAAAAGSGLCSLGRLACAAAYATWNDEMGEREIQTNPNWSLQN